MRRKGIVAVLNTMARNAERARRHGEAQQRRALRERQHMMRQAERERILEEKEQRRQYLEDRLQEVTEQNEELGDTIKGLKGVLPAALKKSSKIDFDSLRLKEKPPVFSPPDHIAHPAPSPQKEDFLRSVKPPNWFTKFLPGTVRRHEERLTAAEQKHKDTEAEYEKTELVRQANLKKLADEHEKHRKHHSDKVQKRDEEVNQFRAAYSKGEESAVLEYYNAVLENSEYPDDFPHAFRIAYLPDSKQLVVELEFPAAEIVPSIQEYRYVKGRDEIDGKPRKMSDIRDLYQDVVMSTTLRTIYEVLESDQGNHVNVVVFSGFVNTVDPATGKNIRRCLISVRTTKERFNEIDLNKVDKRTCLRNLGAQVSPRPFDMQAVKPIIEFDMVDKRFVDERDMLLDIENRPNLMDLNPFEFENLVCNLFGKMGLETKLTRSSRDGGVDAVAFDSRPVLGGKVIIQAKRYKNVVGVAAVRDLYGTMMNEGANKGILVCTSHYGPDAYEFSKDKPVELIDGGGLLYLLEQNGIQARIIFPDDR